MKIFKLGKKGQTATEYILLLAVTVAIMVPLFKKLDSILVGGDGSFIKKYLVTQETSAFFEGNYRYFSIRK